MLRICERTFYTCSEFPGVVENMSMSDIAMGDLFAFQNPQRKKDFETFSGIKIVNDNNKVYINNHNKEVNIQHAIFDFLNSIEVDKEQVDLLNSSEILVVYGVFKGKDDKESVIWGLAKDKETGKNFHWLTDLKE